MECIGYRIECVRCDRGVFSCTCNSVPRPDGYAEAKYSANRSHRVCSSCWARCGSSFRFFFQSLNGLVFAAGSLLEWSAQNPGELRVLSIWSEAEEHDNSVFRSPDGVQGVYDKNELHEQVETLPLARKAAKK